MKNKVISVILQVTLWGDLVEAACPLCIKETNISFLDPVCVSVKTCVITAHSHWNMTRI